MQREGLGGAQPPRDARARRGRPHWVPRAGRGRRLPTGFAGTRVGATHYWPVTAFAPARKLARWHALECAAREQAREGPFGRTRASPPRAAAMAAALGVAGRWRGARRAASEAAASCRRCRAAVTRRQRPFAASAAGGPSAPGGGGGDPWADLGLAADVCDAARNVGAGEPTPVQRAAVPGIVAGQDTVVASHTGSGKTLAYLLPVVHSLRAAEAAAAAAAADGGAAAGGVVGTSRPRRPRALVLSPTRELATQIGEVAKKVGHVAKFRSGVVVGGAPWGPQRSVLQRPLDVVVGTPARLLGHNANGDLFFGDVSTLVLDEADTLLDDSGFRPEVDKLLEICLKSSEADRATGRAATDRAQLVVVSATMTAPVRKLVEREMGSEVNRAGGGGGGEEGSYNNASTDTLHSAAAGARHEFISCGATDKLTHLKESLQRLHFNYVGPTIVFCNTIASARAVEHLLREDGVRTLSCHGGMTPQARLDAINEYKSATSEAISRRDAGNLGGGADGMFASELVEPVMISSDLSARGLDFSKGVARVINFDMPQDTVTYLHRTGRTARAGQKGLVVSLVTKRDRELAERIRINLERGLPLDMPVNKKQAKRDEAPKRPRGGRRVAARERARGRGGRGAGRGAGRGNGRGAGRGGGRGRGNKRTAASGGGKGSGGGGYSARGTGSGSGGGGGSGPGWSSSSGPGWSNGP